MKKRTNFTFLTLLATGLVVGPATPVRANAFFQTCGALLLPAAVYCANRACGVIAQAKKMRKTAQEIREDGKKIPVARQISNELAKTLESGANLTQGAAWGCVGECMLLLIVSALCFNQ